MFISLVWVAEWPPFVKELPAGLANLFSLSFVYFRFGFKGRILLLIVSDSVHCFSITFISFGLLIRTEWNCF